MKKILTVLLVLSVAAASVFAFDIKLTGYAQTTAELDIDNKTFGFTPKQYLKATVTGTTTTKKNEGDVYATVTAKIAFSTKSYTAYDVSDHTGNFSFAVADFYITAAKIVAENWSVNLFSANNVADFASSWEKDSSGYNTYSTYKAESSEFFPFTNAGIVVTVDGYSIGFNPNIDFEDSDNTTLDVAVSTKSYDIAEGLTAKAALGVIYTGSADEVKFQPGATATFKNDEVSATVAVDSSMAVTAGQFALEQVEASATASVAGISLKAYYLLDADKPYKTTAYIDGLSISVSDFGKTNYLSAYVSYDINENINVHAFGLDLINTQYVGLGADYEAEDWAVGFFSHYDFDDRTAIGEVYGSKDFEDIGTVDAYVDVDYDEAFGVYGGVGLTNTTFVSGCTLCLSYDSGNLLEKEFGSVTASAKIAF